MFGQPLFRDADLAAYLRQREAAIEPRVVRNVQPADLAKSDAEIVVELLRQAAVHPLHVDFDDPAAETAEVRITTADNFYGRVEIAGVRAIRAFAFTGDPDLFGMRPSRWSGSPRGEVADGHVVLGVEGPNDPEWLRQELDRREAILREYVADSTAQVEIHNAAVMARLADAVARRRELLEEVENFRRRYC